VSVARGVVVGGALEPLGAASHEAYSETAEKKFVYTHMAYKSTLL